jgi:hypothetical protein
MHTIMVLSAGLAMLAIFIVLARSARVSVGAGAMAFIPIWFIAAAVNMWIGVTRAGYTAAEEFPIFLVIFGVPTVIAMTVWWKNAKA